MCPPVPRSHCVIRIWPRTGFHLLTAASPVPGTLTLPSPNPVLGTAAHLLDEQARKQRHLPLRSLDSRGQLVNVGSAEDGRGEGAGAAWALASLALLFGVLLEGRRGPPGPEGPPTRTPSVTARTQTHLSSELQVSAPPCHASFHMPSSPPATRGVLVKDGPSTSRTPSQDQGPTLTHCSQATAWTSRVAHLPSTPSPSILGPAASGRDSAPASLCSLVALPPFPAHRQSKHQSQTRPCLCTARSFDALR